MGQVMEIKSFK